MYLFIVYLFFLLEFFDVGFEKDAIVGVHRQLVAEQVFYVFG